VTRPAVSVEDVNSFLAAELPFCAEMNIACDHVGIDVGVTRFAYHDRWTRPGGIVNGGTLMALADVAVYVAIFSRTGIVPLALTNELKMNFLRPAVGSDVVARATLHKLGRRVAFASVDVAEPQAPDRLVAHATASYVLPGPP
jgi:uncharacterized protein (TIGR00369 family)